MENSFGLKHSYLIWGTVVSTLDEEMKTGVQGCALVQELAEG